jgi:hypothetical protein
VWCNYLSVRRYPFSQTQSRNHGKRFQIGADRSCPHPVGSLSNYLFFCKSSGSDCPTHELGKFNGVGSSRERRDRDVAADAILPQLGLQFGVPGDVIRKSLFFVGGMKTYLAEAIGERWGSDKMKNPDIGSFSK